MTIAKMNWIRRHFPRPCSSRSRSYDVNPEDAMGEHTVDVVTKRVNMVTKHHQEMVNNGSAPANASNRIWPEPGVYISDGDHQYRVKSTVYNVGNYGHHEAKIAFKSASGLR
ncbi:hypothetical protein L596_028707 [Steinernema carpocapsae]|uniref:Uncharacterized protein n=1 Tax=Steinernema carpocapsae TaxID=34508 RepID=A0A4U5LZ52_STECR|nr:hypothetical protein L596_028707 [Steinernema carpocapsae]